MTPESQARLKIDQLLTDAGWIIQDYKQINLGASLGIAVREYSLKSGFVDYLLIINRKAAGVIEAKKVGIPLSGVETQSDKYSFQLPPKLNCHRKPLPFLYESTGVETYFTDNRDPDFCSRKVFSFHKPETLQEWLGQSDTLRVRLQLLPTIYTEDLRECQKEAIAGLFNSLKHNRPRALIQMATGVGKTYTSVSFIYWLIKLAGAKRVLFLVDRRNLGEQTQKEFQQYVTPDDGRKFTELYNVQLLTSNTIDPVNKVCITTIQRLYSMLRGEADFEAENEEASLFDGEPSNQQPKDVVYNLKIPLETFDFIVTDECHRSIYNVWRQVLEYFDAFIIGLTATPSLQTFGFFNQNLVMEYPHERAVADGVNVGYEVYRIRTQITEQGSTIESGFYVDTRNRQTRAVRNSETWIGLDIDVKGEIYEGLLQKNAEDVKGGAGQYFTPRALIQAIVEVMQPQLGQRICDPACGTGGFFLVAYNYIKNHYKLDKDQRYFLNNKTFKGADVADGVVRLCAMNLYLHGIAGDDSPVEAKDSLMADSGDRFELILTNPPFGKKSSITVFKDDGKADKEKVVYRRDDFWATTSNKQLNFLQHVKTLLQINGKAAVVVPDNVLFEGGAGETIRKKLLHECDVHTLLRLPTGIFYAQGVKANVLFFDRKPASANPWTKKLWIYDFRTNQHFTLKTNTLRSENLQNFIQSFNADNGHERQENERFRVFSYEELIQRDKVSLDIFWLKDESLEDSDNLPAPDVLALEIAEDLGAALELFQGITENLEVKL